MVSPMPNFMYDIGKGVDRLLRCKRVHPCFLVFFLFVAGCAIATGVVYLVRGPGEIIQIALFSLTLILIFLLFASHVYYVNRKQQTTQPPENI